MHRAIARAIILATVLSGCASHRHGPQPVKPATVGADLLRAPRGQTIPAAGLGVDLVRTPVSPPNEVRGDTRDPEVSQASSAGSGYSVRR
jgi:hypothetical protein